MARRYSLAKGMKSPLSIQDLDNGCKWVDQYLINNKCEYINSVDQQGGKSRYTYNISGILNQSNGLSQTLEQIVVEEAATSLIEYVYFKLIF